MEFETQIIIPDSMEHWLAMRQQDVTSTDAAALFGLSPHRTLLELWYDKRDGEPLIPFEQDERMEWGQLFEPAIATWRARREGVAIRELREYIRAPKFRLGTSLDYGVLADPGDTSPLAPIRKIYECKNVSYLEFRDNWEETTDGLAAPDWIEIQVQQEMGLARVPEAEIVVCIGGCEGFVLHREFNHDVFAGIVDATQEFWNSIRRNVPPKPDFTRDLAALKQIHGYAQPGKVIEDPEDPRILELMQAASEASRIAARATLDKETAQAELITLIGDAERVRVNGWKLFAGVTGPADVPAYRRNGFRQLRITPPKSA